jgi:hypothetical protein
MRNTIEAQRTPDAACDELSLRSDSPKPGEPSNEPTPDMQNPKTEKTANKHPARRKPPNAQRSML